MDEKGDKDCKHGKRVIDDDGEIIDYINPGDRVVRKNSINYLQDTEEWKIEHFYKGHIGEIRKVMKDLSIYEKAFLLSVATYIGYEDCCLKHDNGNELTFDGLVDISGMSRSKLLEVINSLIKKDILYRGKNSEGIQYFINPWLFCKGNRINKVLKAMFENYRIRVLGGVQWKNARI